MLRFAQIKSGIIENIILVAEEDNASNFLLDYDYIVNINDLNPIPQIGYIYNGINFSAPDPSIALSFNLKLNIKARKDFADQLLEDFKFKNINEGINALQGLYMHSRMRELPITFMGLSMKVDILNMAVSGDLEVAALALLYCTPDDMSQPYHWFSVARRDYLVFKLKEYLGWP